MKFDLKYLPYLVIAGLVVYIFLLRECSGGSECQEVVKVDTVVKTRTLRDTLKIKGDKIKVTDTLRFTDTIHLTKLDTVRIVQRFLDTIVQNSVWNDSIVSLDITDTITRNRIIGRLLSYQLTLRDTTINTTKTINRNKFFIGAGIGYVNEPSLSLHLNAALLTKRDNLYTIGNDLLSEQPNLQVSAYWKISFRKRSIKSKSFTD